MPLAIAVLADSGGMEFSFSTMYFRASSILLSPNEKGNLPAEQVKLNRWLEKEFL